MAEFNDSSQKGTVLMQHALKKLEDGDVEGFEHDRKEANRYFDMFYKEINSEMGKIKHMYGESLNFGVIYNVFEQNIDDLYKTKKGKRIIKEVYNLIKNDKLLNEQFKIYDLFEKSTNIENVKDFVNESLSLVKNYNKKDIIKANSKLIKLIESKKLNEFVEIPEEVENLYEAVEYLMLNKKTFNNVNDYLNAQNVIVEHIENNNKSVINEKKETLTIDTFEEMLDEEQNKFDEKLNEDEKKLIAMFTNKNSKNRDIFETYKRKTLHKINEVLEKSEEEDKEQWKNVYENVKAKMYTDNVSKNIVNCAEMIEICNTIDE